MDDEITTAMADVGDGMIRDRFMSATDLGQLIDGLEDAVEFVKEQLLVSDVTPRGQRWVERLSPYEVRLVRLRYCAGVGLEELSENFASVAQASIERRDQYTVSATPDDFGPLLRLFGLHDLTAQFSELSAHRKYTRLADIVLGAERAADRANYGEPLGDWPLVDRRMALVEILHQDNSRVDALVDYVNDWYTLCKDEVWWGSADTGGGLYSGYWCFEAAALAVVLDVDDSDLDGHPNYPYDLSQFSRNKTGPAAHGA